MNLTDHFTLEELTASDTAVRLGLDNTPTPEIVRNLRLLAEKLEEVRSILGKPIIVSSGYRSLDVNRALRSKDNSAHVQGLAADFICPQFGAPLEVAEKLAAAGVKFDQLIHEYGRWVHIGLKPAYASWRGELLTIDRTGAHAGLQVV